MNKKDLPVFLVLIALVILFPIIDRKFIAPMFPKKAPPPAATNAVARATAPAVPGATNAAVQTPPELRAAPEPAPGATNAAAAAAAAAAEPPSPGDGRTVALTNADVALTFSTRGAGLVGVRIVSQRRSVDPKSSPVEFDFSAEPALSYEGIPGLGAAYDFDVKPGENGRSLTFERRSAAGLKVVRTVSLAAAGYLVDVRDEFRAEGAAPVEIKRAGLRLGSLHDLPGETRQSGIAFLGIDTLSPGERVKNWGAKLPGRFKEAAAEQNLPKAPVELRRALLSPGTPADWVAVKNKYFVQILKPDERFVAIDTDLRRQVLPKEADPTYKPAVVLQSVSAVAFCLERTLLPGGEPFVRNLSYYIGPKKYDELNRLDSQRVEVMEFGMWGAIGKILLRTLNWIYAAIGNYGVAIMLLTIIVRVLFWPLTHKSTQSMKRMAEVQPLVNELRAKYKDNPQRQQKEIMQLYRERKINPLGGCLPILIQIPVFIALFVVLRSAIELRFAPFLWVRDLSEPENLLAGVLPFGLSLNILPLLMTATQVWQQKLTPSAGDPMQQKMMTWMPVIMLLFFYSFASGLVLYWTTNQVLMIVQLLWQKHRREAKKA